MKFIFLAFLCFLNFCSEGKKTKNINFSLPEIKPLQKELKKISFIKKSGGTKTIKVEIADTPQKRARGLMFRKELEPDQGMLFVFEKEDFHEFYMKNTYVPLDMVFINQKKEIVGIVENARPLTQETRKIDTPSLYVLEVPAFFSRRNNIKIGDKIKIQE